MASTSSHFHGDVVNLPHVETEWNEALAGVTTRPRIFRQLEKLGTVALCILIMGTIVLLTAYLFVCFLWFMDHKWRLWHWIMISGHITKAISLSSLCIRRAVGFLTGVCSAMLAALFLELHGVSLKNSPSVAIMRASSSTKPISLRWKLWDVPNVSNNRKDFQTKLFRLLGSLMILYQWFDFTSTILLGDLAYSTIPGPEQSTVVNYGLSRSMLEREIHTETIWQSGQISYPTFAEYSQDPIEPVPEDGVVDTGLTLRAFLPIASMQSRERLQSYSGRATVVDTRVTCQRPALRDLRLEYSGHGVPLVSGKVSASRSTPRLVNSTDMKSRHNHPGVGFGCFVSARGPARVGPYSWPIFLCQLFGNNFTGPAPGGLVSEFQDLAMAKADPTMAELQRSYLVLNVTELSSQSVAKDVNSIPPVAGYVLPPDTLRRDHLEWADAIFLNGHTTVISMTICHTAFDTADMNIEAKSDTNRTEPIATYDSSEYAYTFHSLGQQLGRDNRWASAEDRGILRLEPRSSWVTSNYGLSADDLSGLSKMH